MTWQDQIKAAIKQRGWTQAETAQRIGITPSYLSDILRGRRPLSARVAVRMAMILDVGAWELLESQMSEQLAIERAVMPREMEEIP